MILQVFMLRLLKCIMLAMLLQTELKNIKRFSL